MVKNSKDRNNIFKKEFSVRILNRAELEYKEGRKVMLVDAEMLGDDSVGFAVASNSINRWKGSRQKINTKEKKRIINNIRKFFRSQGYEIDVVGKK